MVTIALGQASSCESPLLEIKTRASGLPVDVAALSFQIWDLTGATPAQLYPVTLGEKAVVAVGVACPDGDHLGLGHYLARWAPASIVGTHEIRWFVRLEVGSPELTYVETFSVVSAAGVWTGPAYTTVAALRDEGVTVTQASDTRLRTLIDLASRLVESITGQWFDARASTLRLDGDGSDRLLLPVPIVSVSEVRVDGEAMELADVVVYNRLVPDDRRNPKLGLRSGRWPCGEQAVEVDGVFGFVDRVGPDAVTPAPIERATQLLIIRELERLASPDREGARHGYRLLEEQTRDQRYKLAELGSSSGTFMGGTGDPEIDSILRRFMRPIAVGSA